MLLELRVGQVRGFDLSLLDAYRWHPGTERVEIDRFAGSSRRRWPALAMSSCDAHMCGVGATLDSLRCSTTMSFGFMDTQPVHCAGCPTSACRRPSTC